MNNLCSRKIAEVKTFRKNYSKQNTSKNFTQLKLLENGLERKKAREQKIYLEVVRFEIPVRISWSI